MKTIISPSLLSCDFLNMEPELRAFAHIPDLWFHLDIMDAHFVPNLTFGHPIVKKLSAVAKIPLDAHFMVTNPEFFIDTFSGFNIHNVTFHTEATKNEEELLRLVAKAQAHYESVGISIKPGTPVSSVSDKVLQSIDLFLMMSVEPGFGGQAFIENSYNKLDELAARRKALGAQFQIQVDGGVGKDNAPKLVAHGVNNLVAGSYIFQGSPQEYQNRVESLR